MVPKQPTSMVVLLAGVAAKAPDVPRHHKQSMAKSNSPLHPWKSWLDHNSNNGLLVVVVVVLLAAEVVLVAVELVAVELAAVELVAEVDLVAEVVLAAVDLVAAVVLAAVVVVVVCMWSNGAVLSCVIRSSDICSTSIGGSFIS